MPAPGAAVRLHVFGGIAAYGPDGPIRLGGPQERMVLAILLIHRPESLTTERLADALWPDDPPPTAAKTIQVHITRLRAALGPTAIERVADGYRLSSGIAVDLDEAERALRAGLAGAADDPLVALERLETGLAISAGQPFADVPYQDWIHAESERLGELLGRAREARFELLLRQGRTDTVLTELPALARADPLREGLWRTLMRAQLRAGEPARALATYEEARRTLASDLGVEPGKDLMSLWDSILRGDVTELPDPRPTLTFPPRLPTPTTSFVGRGGLVVDLTERLRPGGERLVTLVGPGGTGKTRLALEVASGLTHRYAGAVAFIDLSAVPDPDLVWPAIREAIAADGSVEARIGPNRALLVLDNLEQVIDVAPRLSVLLRSCPRLQVLATSRTPLRIEGERQIAVDPLQPSEAAELFHVRAAAVTAEVESQGVVEAICERLDHLPLAIELAALQVRSFSGRELLSVLERRLASLMAGPRDAPVRHKTMQATIAWSHDLLSDSQRRLFARLAVFAGGWTPAAALAVCGATNENLRGLIEASLVRRDGERMGMLETIREFAAERMESSGEGSLLRARHADYFIAEARRQKAAADEATGGVFRVLIDDVANQRLALEHLCAEAVTDRALELAMSMWTTWFAQGRVAEGDAWFQRAMARASTAGGPGWQKVLGNASEFPRFLGEYERAEAMKLESLRIARLHRDDVEVAGTLRDLGELVRQRRDLATARTYLQDSLAIRRNLGKPSGIAHAALGLADLEADEGHLGVAEALYDQALTIARRDGLLASITQDVGALALIRKGRVRLLCGDTAGAGPLIAEGIDIASQLGLIDSVRVGLDSMAALLSALGDDASAVMLLGAAAGIRDRYGFVDDTAFERTELELGIRARLGEVAERHERAEGANAPLATVVELGIRRWREAAARALNM
jgi:predicted ATPase/DNA-binding SARP family transcriptional activator